MKSSRTRSWLVSAFVLVLVGIGWFYLAPSRIGGSTTYVVTHGISMEPRIHTGDLVLVRPESNYRVGQVVAYRSTLLHTVVLHRIIRIEDGHYVFKGDNNSFIDPTHPTRALLIGRMWLHIAGGGVVLDWLHRPWLAAVLLGAVAALLLFGGERKRRRRRDRGRRGAANRTRRAPPVTSISAPPGGAVNSRQLLAASLAGLVVFAILSVVAWVLPTTTTTTTGQPYSQQVNFGYHARAAAGPVYPDGIVSTGDPIYIQLVHRIALTATYRITTAASARLHGTMRIRGTLANGSGWHRSFWLGPATQFAGDHARATAVISLTQLQSLADRVTAQIGSGAGYTLAVVPQVNVAGRIAGQPLSTAYKPALNLTLGTSQFASGTSALGTPSSSSGSATSALPGLSQSVTGNATTSRTTAATLAGVPVRAVRWIALLALALCALLVYRLLTGSRDLGRPRDPAERIRSRYKHLIVPVEPVTPSPDHPPIDVSSIDALAQLAERSERLILHDHRDDVDDYLIDDQGTLFRFRAPRRNGTASVNGASANGVNSPSTAGVGTASARVNGTASAGVTGKASAGVNGTSTRPGPAKRPSRPTPVEPAAVDPVADAAAAILSSAAATLSAAAAQATAGPSPAAEAAHAPAPPGSATAAIPDAGPPSSAGGAAAAARVSAPTASVPAPGAAVPAPRVGVPTPRAGVPTPRAGVSAPGAAVTGLGGRPTPDLLVVGAEARRPPIPAPDRWTSRPEVRAGLAIGPLALTLLAWRRFRTRRRRIRGHDYEEQRFAKRSWTTRNLERR